MIFRAETDTASYLLEIKPDGEQIHGTLSCGNQTLGRVSAPMANGLRHLLAQIELHIQPSERGNVRWESV